MENTHTPGPWNIYPMGNYFGIDSQDGRIIITFGDGDEEFMGVRGDSYEEMKANSTLIAAAPEMLEALEGLQDILNNHYGDDKDETHLMDKAFEAIKKARGL
jgi:hypothetical protein